MDDRRHRRNRRAAEEEEARAEAVPVAARIGVLVVELLVQERRIALAAVPGIEQAALPALEEAAAKGPWRRPRKMGIHCRKVQLLFHTWGRSM